MTDIDAAATALDTALLTATPMPGFGDDLTLADAYAVQRALTERRQGRGERVIGAKMGFTSRAKMLQMGVEAMIWGRLTDAMLVDDGGEVDLSAYIHPRVEPELAFLVGKRLSGRVSMMDGQAGVEAVAPAMVIIYSRYQAFRFSLPDVVADNTSAAGLVVGAWRRAGVDFANNGMVMSIDGRVVQVGSSAAILGHPLRALVAAAALAAASGEALEPGDILLAGAATAAEPLRPGAHILVEAQYLGQAAFTVG